MVLGLWRIGSYSFKGRMDTCEEQQTDSGSGQDLHPERQTAAAGQVRLICEQSSRRTVGADRLVP